MSSSSKNSITDSRPLRAVFSDAKAPFTELTQRLLFCTTLHAGDRTYRIREIELYAPDDPYTHCGDEQVSTCCGWYFHRTKPGGGWKGGTFMGLDISFAPVGTAGGVLLRGISRCSNDKDSYQYFDGPCNCVRELLSACKAKTIRDLVDNPAFKLDALTEDGIMRLVEHDESLPPINGSVMEWKGASRVGLSVPGKKPEQKEARAKFHLAPLRFLSAPYETKKEKTKINNAPEGGVFSMKILEEFGQKETKKHWFDDSDDDEEFKPKKKRLRLKLKPEGNKNVGIWHYWLGSAMDGKETGWHPYDQVACSKLEDLIQSKKNQLSDTTCLLKSGYFSYEVDVIAMTQINLRSGTVRPIRRVLPGDKYSMLDPPVPSSPVKSSSTTEYKTPLPTSTKLAVPPKKTAINAGPSTDLKLEPLFAGQYGYAWEKSLTQTLESLLPKAADFIGPDRSKEILPVREMTFRSLMALPPEQNNLIVFGQAPYPRIESASGIAMFDSLINNWDCAQFGKTVSMRCIAKTAAVAKGIVPQDAKISDMRKAFRANNIVSPPEWFQSMLAQGVLLLNASLTNGVFSTAQHTKFWMPVMKRIVEEILRCKRDKFPAHAPKRRVAFLWWGNEALKTKKALAPVLAAYESDLEITHIQHFNPAAQGDKFSKAPNHFQAVNAALIKGNLDPIDWLPNKDWLEEHHIDEQAAFITETQELHKMYLDRLQSGLDTVDIAPISGIMGLELQHLVEACDPIGLESAASSALSTVASFDAKDLTEHEKGAVYLYTTNVLYRRLNEALRHPNRSKIKVYFHYLRIFLEAYAKMKPQPRVLYRGINKDLSKMYKVGGKPITWWTISSCTPNVNVAKSFGGGSANGTLFHVQTKTAVPIMHLSAFKSEEEFVLAPGTILKIVKTIKSHSNQATQIYLEEVEGERYVG